MNTNLRITCLMIAALAVSGCSTMLANEARSDLAAQCASMGPNMRFLQGETHKSDNPLFSKASVQGQCVGPDHPEYENAVAPEE
ncbi:hypothetical protein [Aurantiacibacter flavus]|uniref:hypothetical protein n=1 Tax=Aurantiacibacter flavus TaxID=3145232 RepID=UPI0032170331